MFLHYDTVIVSNPLFSRQLRDEAFAVRFSTFLSPACSNANRARFFRLKERERPPFFLINPQSSLRKTPCRGILKPFDYSRAVYRKESDHGCRYERCAAFKMKEL